MNVFFKSTLHTALTVHYDLMHVKYLGYSPRISAPYGQRLNKLTMFVKKQTYKLRGKAAEMRDLGGTMLAMWRYFAPPSQRNNEILLLLQLNKEFEDPVDKTKLEQQAQTLIRNLLYICVFTHVHIQMYKHTCMYVCMYVCRYVCMYVYIYTYIYICMHICIYIHYVFIRTHKYTHTYYIYIYIDIQCFHGKR